jgi:hypothetical protein
MIEDSALKLLPKPIDLQELDDILQELDEIVTNAPNSLEEFEAELVKTSPQVPALPYVSQSELKTDSPIDKYSVYQEVIRLKTDAALERVVEIIARYEAAYSHARDVIEIDLSRCRDDTLRRIHNYVRQVEREEKE